MRVMIVGSTGLVGQGVLNACRAARDVEQIVLPVRRHMDAAQDARELVWPVDDLFVVDGSEPQFAGLDACIHCAGVVPGLSEAAFRRVTVDLTLHVARAFARANPRGTFVYVSGAGSNADSALMPLRVKGQAEDALRALDIRTLMLRPGIVQPVDGVRSPHGMRAVAAYAAARIAGAAQLDGLPSVNDSEDYYSASLILLVRLACAMTGVRVG